MAIWNRKLSLVSFDLAIKKQLIDEAAKNHSNKYFMLRPPGEYSSVWFIFSISLDKKKKTMNSKNIFLIPSFTTRKIISSA